MWSYQYEENETPEIKIMVHKCTNKRMHASHYNNNDKCTLRKLTVKFDLIGHATHCSLSKNNFNSSSLALKIVTITSCIIIVTLHYIKYLW